MESINETLEKAIQFLLIIQTVCERRRSQIEQASLKCYSSYLKDKKEELSTKEKEVVNVPQLKNNQEEAASVSLDIDCLKELALADLLLEKAEAIRNQSKASSKIMPKYPKSSEIALKNDAGKTSCARKIASDNSTRNQAALPRCNSAPNAFMRKLPKELHSKSVNDFISKRDVAVPITVSNFRKYNRASSSHGSAKTLLSSKVGCISNKSYKDLKSFTVNKCFDKHRAREEGNTDALTNTSGSSLNPYHLSLMSYQSFKRDFTKKCCLDSKFQLSSNGFWYSFISLKNKESLIGWSKSETIENFITVVNLTHEIQEMLMWIDLLSYIGKEVFPNISLVNDKNKNLTRLCSYLSSIYHESLQRIPMLDL